MPDSHDFNELLAKVYGSIEENKEYAFSVSDDIAAHPELSGEEFRTAEIFCGWLKDEGFVVEMPYCGMETAFIASNRMRFELAKKDKTLNSYIISIGTSSL